MLVSHNQQLLILHNKNELKINSRLEGLLFSFFHVLTGMKIKQNYNKRSIGIPIILQEFSLQAPVIFETGQKVVCCMLPKHYGFL